MLISSFNINKFCGPYSYTGYYYNPRNIDFKNPIKEIIISSLKTKYDIFFLQECHNNQYIEIKKLFPDSIYSLYCNVDYSTKSYVMAITLKCDTPVWKKIEPSKSDYSNKILEMKLDDKNLSVVCFHNTHKDIESIINNDYFSKNKVDVILGDYDDSDWINTLNNNSTLNYRDLVTNDMITFKPAQTSVDRIFIKKREDFDNRIIFNGITETFLSDHNIVSFTLNI